MNNRRMGMASQKGTAGKKGLEEWGQGAHGGASVLMRVPTCGYLSSTSVP